MNISKKFYFYNRHVLKHVFKMHSTELRYKSSVSTSNTKVNSFADIKFPELKDKIDKKEVLLIDVRNPNELEKDGFIQGSLNIPLAPLGDCMLLSPEDFAKKVGVPKPPLDTHLVTLCLIGIRARTAQLALVAAGYTNVSCYRGSLEDWINNDGKIVNV